MSVAPRLRASASGLVAVRHRLRKNRYGAFIVRCRRVKPRSGSGKVVPDEAFAIRDSQFDYPHVGILPCSAVQIVFKILFIVRYLHFRSAPFAASIKVWHAFVKNTKRLIFHDNEQNGSAIAFTLVQNHGKAAIGLNRTDDPLDFEMRRESRFHRRADQASAARRPAL